MSLKPALPLRYTHYNPTNSTHHWLDAENRPWKSPVADPSTPMMTPEFAGPHSLHKAPLSTRTRRLMKTIYCNVRGIDREPDSDDDRYAEEYMMRRDSGCSRASLARVGWKKGKRGRGEVKGVDGEGREGLLERGQWKGAGVREKDPVVWG